MYTNNFKMEEGTCEADLPLIQVTKKDKYALLINSKFCPFLNSWTYNKIETFV